jgi:hypothetical protein
MDIFKILFFVFLFFLIIAWCYLCYYLGLGIVSIFGRLLDYYENFKSKKDTSKTTNDLELEDISEINELFASLQGLQVDFVTIEDEETYLSVYDEKALTISLEPTSNSEKSIKDGCFLIPAFKWRLVYNTNSKQAGQLICSYADSLISIENANDILEGKKVDRVEFLSDEIQLFFEEITLHMEIGHNDSPTCYIEIFLPHGQTRTIAIKTLVR